MPYSVISSVLMHIHFPSPTGIHIRPCVLGLIDVLEMLDETITQTGSMVAGSACPRPYRDAGNLDGYVLSERS